MAYTLGWLASDWEITSGKAINYIGGDHGTGTASYVTVLDFHRALQDFADDAAASGDDLLDISSLTPSDRSTDNIVTLLNGFTINDTAAEHIYNGSIIQSGGDTIYDGVVNFGTAKYIIISQNGAVLNDTTGDYWNSYSANAGENYTFPPSNTQAGISHNFMVKVRDAGADIDGRYLLGLTREFNYTYSEFTIQGTSRGLNVLALSESLDLNNETTAGTLATWDQFTNTEGYDDTNDVSLTVDPEWYYSRWDWGSGATPATPAINDLYEFAKYETRRGTASTLYNIEGDIFRGITHELPYTGASGAFTTGEFLDIGSVTDAARVLADDNNGATGTLWIQLMKLSTSTSGDPTLTGDSSTSTATLTSASVASFTPGNVFLGQSTGSALIGGYGVGVDSGVLTKDDKLTELNAGALVEPPNNVTFTVSGVVHDEDYILVAPATSGAINTTQMLVNSDLTGAAVGSIQMQAAIPTDTPSAGTIRVINDSGFHVLLNYTSFSGDTFTISPTYDFSGTEENDGVTAANNNGAYITYIDTLAQSSVINATTMVDGVEYEIATVGTTDFTTYGAASNTVGVRFTASSTPGTGTGTVYPVLTSESFQVVFDANRDLFVRVRDGGGAGKNDTPIKTFETPATLTTAGGSVSAIRTSDL